MIYKFFDKNAGDISTHKGVGIRTFENQQLANELHKYDHQKV